MSGIECSSIDFEKSRSLFGGSSMKSTKASKSKKSVAKATKLLSTETKSQELFYFSINILISAINTTTLSFKVTKNTSISDIKQQLIKELHFNCNINDIELSLNEMKMHNENYLYHYNIIDSKHSIKLITKVKPSQKQPKEQYSMSIPIKSDNLNPNSKFNNVKISNVRQTKSNLNTIWLTFDVTNEWNELISYIQTSYGKHSLHFLVTIDNVGTKVDLSTINNGTFPVSGLSPNISRNCQIQLYLDNIELTDAGLSNCIINIRTSNYCNHCSGKGSSIQSIPYTDYISCGSCQGLGRINNGDRECVAIACPACNGRKNFPARTDLERKLQIHFPALYSNGFSCEKCQGSGIDYEMRNIDHWSTCQTCHGNCRISTTKYRNQNQTCPHCKGNGFN